MKYFLGICLLFCCLHLSAQEKHFIFIQSDNSQPFYVSLSGKLYSSSASGYLIIPKLPDGEYKFVVGFAKNEFPEQSFQCVINKKDLGYNLKNFGEKGWGLFNFQTLDVTMAGASNTNDVAKAVKEISAPKTPDEPVISFDKPKKDTSAAEPLQQILTDTLVSSAGAASTSVTDTVATQVPEEKVAAVADTTSAQKPPKPEEPIVSPYNALKKVSEVRASDGLHISYVDGSGKNSDTIQVIIPVASSGSIGADDIIVKSDSKGSPTEGGNLQKSPSPARVTDKDGVKFLDIDMSGVAKDSVAVASGKTDNTSPVLSSGNCKNIATDEDYARLRKKMAMETSDEKMINEAKKFYRNKCFTTSQIKGLSSLFLSDEGRYKFFDASYVSAVDAGQYSSLQSEFIDPAFATRFKAMLQ